MGKCLSSARIALFNLMSYLLTCPVISESPNDKFNSKGTKTSYETNMTKFILSNFVDEKTIFCIQA